AHAASARATAFVSYRDLSGALGFDLGFSPDSTTMATAYLRHPRSARPATTRALSTRPPHR
ncbi:hypothetical protein, partial [Streptomyces sp. YS-3]|uniref:hypothetical protein n=1 Tax=Streptomyces sp. YS-3 TaxID=3381352 RepID=UPI003862B4B3